MTATIASDHLTLRRDAPADAWRQQATLLAVAASAILLLFWHDAVGMASIWWDASTYNHCLLIVPLIAWLAWQRRAELAELTPVTWRPGLLLAAIGAAAWLLGYAGSIALGRHLGLILMLQGAIVTLFGKAVARGLAFPIFYLLFLVPFGDEVLPAMQTLTAKLAMALLNVSGTPAHLQGVFITTPSGYFEVAEACAGVKFLVAMVALGALVANLCFRSWTRRIAFMAVSVAVPVLANGVRAWGTVYVAEGTSVEYASGFDHIVYGWFFFAGVIALIMAVAWRFFDRRVGEPWFDAQAFQPVPPAREGERHAWRSLALLGAVIAAPVLWSTAIGAAGRQEPPAEIVMPDLPGWTRTGAAAGTPWRPSFAGADRFATATYRNAAGQEVTLAVALFARQEEGRELVGFGQGAVALDSGWAWSADGNAPAGGRDELLAGHGAQREVVSFYRVGDILTGSAARVKLETMRVRLIGGPQRAVAVLISAQTPAGGSPRPSIDDFLGALGPIDAFADRAAGTQ